jgi:hypothetical protein
MQTRAFQWVMPGLAEISATDVTVKERSARMSTIANRREDTAERKVCLHVVAFIIRRGAVILGQLDVR